MTTLNDPRRTVSSWPHIVGLAALIVVVAVCTLSTPAQAAGWPRQSDDVITINPVPRFDESEVRALIEKPAVTFGVDKPRISKGQSAKLTWRVENADSVSITGLAGIGKSGSRTVSPTKKTTYKLTARNSNGTVTKAVTVDVTELAAVIGTVHVVRVTGPLLVLEKIAYDFVAKANTATWQGNRRLSFGGSGGTSGWARKIGSVRAEDNKDYTNVLQMEPTHKPNGFVYGRYVVPIPPNGRFAATVGFTRGHGSPDGATVTVLVRGPVIRRRHKPPWKTVALKKITRNGTLDTLTADLKAYANQTVTIQLQVNAGRNYQDDMVLWIAPRILK